MTVTNSPRAIEAYRDVLYLTAQLNVDRALQGKLDLSGVVQQTMWEAHQQIATFQGSTESELLAWLRRILTNNLMDEVRRIRRVGHDVRLDVSIHQTSARLEAVLAAEHTPPESRAIKNEEWQRLTRSLMQLTVEQRQAVVAHYLQKSTLNEVATEMGKTREAVAGLIHRGVLRLRELMQRDQEVT